MSNKFRPHLLIIAEDAAYSSLVNGFLQHQALAVRKVKTETPIGGWSKLEDIFGQVYADGVRKYSERRVLLLLDLDGKSNRSARIINGIPLDIKDRVFVLSCLGETENLKADLGAGSFETLGMKLAESCYGDAYADSGSPWLTTQLQHNQPELKRLAEAVRPFLFIVDR